MKHNPYVEIIDLEAEQKEYAKLCNGKSKKFHHYTDWEEHITDCLKKFQTQKDLYNFKRFCLNLSRSVGQAPNMALSYFILLATVFVDNILDGVSPIFVLLGAILLIGYMLKKNKEIARESYFYADIIEIIESQEEEFR